MMMRLQVYSLIIVMVIAILTKTCQAFHQRSKLKLLSSSLLRMSSSVSDSWIDELGDDVKLKGVKVSSLPIAPDSGKCIRGVQATESIDGTTPVVSVIADCVLEVTNNKPPTPFPDFASQELWQSSLWYQRLAFQLLYELHIEKNQKKLLWFQQFPESYSTPFYWDDTALSELQYDAIRDKVKEQRTEWQEFYDKWQQETSSGSGISYKEFVWAMESVNSRAFSGAYEGSTASERRNLLLFTGALTIVWPLLDLGTYEQSISAALVVGLSILARDIIFSRFSGLRRYTICPVIDMYNHNSNSPSEVSYNYFSNEFVLIPGRAYNKGDQVFISYGKQSNDRFLQFYGFVEEMNPNDFYDFGVGFLELALRYADQIAAASPLPKNPSPRERLTVISAALQNTEVDEATTTGQRTRTSVASGDQLTTRLYRTPLMRPEENEETLPSKKFEIILEDSLSSDKKKSDPRVIIQRFDDTTVRAMRALYCTEKEWTEIFGSSPDLNEVTLERLAYSASEPTEAAIATALRAIALEELISKPTSLEEDEEELLTVQEVGSGSAKGKVGFGEQTLKSSTKESVTDPSGKFNEQRISILSFRVEKKRLLKHLTEIY